MVALTADWLRQRFAAAPAPALRSELPESEQLVPAAVLVPIVLRPAALTVLLTQRTAHLRDHAGQVSFPGGRCEPDDADAAATALREAQEEIGLLPAQVEVIGILDEYRTGTGFTIIPVVGLVTPPLELKLDDFEVADVFEPPLDFLLTAGNFSRHQVEYRGALREYWAVPWQDRYIWGATAGMLINLRERLELVSQVSANSGL
ncbi:MAG: CoA pyrophosphatase [Gammaproteobacteria bacterium]|nr:CoA pyrophosphatase [Gammaproteobacteria bacterium]MBU1415247.1 CoA pyrophosphatase [Gammaproteobacteria bacterium]